MTDFTCFKCKQPIVFDTEHIGKNGRKIPLDPLTKTPHDCPMREMKTANSPPTQGAVVDLRDKDDHGNEETWVSKEQAQSGTTKTLSNAFTNPDRGGDAIRGEFKYVDHTLKPELKLKILVDPTAEGLAKQYNSFEKPIKFSQYQLAPSLYTIAVYYEEVK